jgi:hypothetical protein
MCYLCNSREDFVSENTDVADGRRGADKKMLKNKGLTRSRPAELKTPRYTTHNTITIILFSLFLNTS